MSATGRSGGRVRVAVLTSVHPPLDMRVFHREARSTAAAGRDVLIIAPGAPAGPVDGVRFASLPSWGGRAGRPLRWPGLVWKALRSRADVYHFHDPELLPVGVLLRWVTRRPVIYDAHEFLVEDIRSKHWIPAPVRSFVARAAGAVERWCARRLSAVVAVTEEMQRRFLEVQPRTVLVRNLIDAPAIAYPPPERRPVVAYAGLMNVQRGLGILYETARRVRDRCPSAEFHVLGPVEWFGLPATERERTEAAWAEVGVRFLGTVPPGDVPGIISTASVGWLPLDPENRNSLLAWPTKLTEYMIVGLPVVASDLPLPSRTIREEGCGIVVDGIDPAAHAGAIAELLEDPARARELGERGRAAAYARYRWSTEAEKLQWLYDQLVASG